MRTAFESQGVGKNDGAHLPWQVRNGFELVVDEQLWGHHDESESVHPVGQGMNGPRPPALMGLCEQRVDRPSKHQRVECVPLRTGDSSDGNNGNSLSAQC